MKFLPTINVYADGIIPAILSGQLILQTGQWVMTGTTGKPSRFVGVTPSGSIVATHPSPTVRMTDFRRHIQYHRSRVA